MLELIRVEYFGKPSKNALNMDLQRETPISVKPRYIAGILAPQVSELGVADIRIRRRPERSVAEVRTTAGVPLALHSPRPARRDRPEIVTSDLIAPNRRFAQHAVQSSKTSGTGH
jgi:hypothetical protein